MPSLTIGITTRSRQRRRKRSDETRPLHREFPVRRGDSLLGEKYFAVPRGARNRYKAMKQLKHLTRSGANRGRRQPKSLFISLLAGNSARRRRRHGAAALAP